MSPLGFDKMLPRDNMMFNLNEGYNLKPPPEPTIIDKLAALDIDIRKLRVKHSNSSCYSNSTMNSFRFENYSKRDKSRHYGNHTNTADFFSDYNSKSHVNSKTSLKSKLNTEMSLEEKILNGYFKIPSNGDANV